MPCGDSLMFEVSLFLILITRLLKIVVGFLKFCQVVLFGILCNIFSLVLLSKPEKQTACADENDLL